MVRSLTITVTSIQIRPYCEDAGEQNEEGQCEDLWETLDLGQDSFNLELLKLPAEDKDAIPLATGTLPVGEYHKVRLFVSEAKVTFVEDITVGHTIFLAYNAEGYVDNDASTETVHDVEIPSAQSTGIKADIKLVVEEADSNANEPETVALLFDADATFRNVIASGSGRVKMPPVLKARPMNQDQGT